MIDRRKLMIAATKVADDAEVEMARLEEAWKGIADSDGADHNAWLAEVRARLHELLSEWRQYVWD